MPCLAACGRRSWQCLSTGGSKANPSFGFVSDLSFCLRAEHRHDQRDQCGGLFYRDQLPDAPSHHAAGAPPVGLPQGYQLRKRAEPGALARTRGGSPTRNDIDEAGYIEIIPKPGVEYLDSYGWEFTTVTQQRVRAFLKNIL